MKYNFDEVINRQGTNAMSTDGFREYIFQASDDMEFPYADEDFIRMWVADMEFATPPEIINAIKERLDNRIFGYTKVFDPEYYNTFVNWTKRHYDWEFSKEYLVTSPGIIPALYELVEYICKPDEKILIVTPSYAFFKHAADHNSIELVTSPLKIVNGHYSIDLDDVNEKTKDEKLTLCIFCNPHNPTGRVWTPEELKCFGEICLRNNVWIISDEIHCDLLRESQIHTPLAKLFPDSDRIITCMAPSKTFNMAGFMFSNVVIPNDDIRGIWNERHLSFDNPLSVSAAQAAYKLGGEWLSQLKHYLDNNFAFVKEFLDTYLPEAVFEIPESTYLAWINISYYLSDEDNVSLYFANNAGVLLEDGSMFVDNAHGYIRLNLACPISVLEEGLKRIAKVLLEK